MMEIKKRTSDQNPTTIDKIWKIWVHVHLDNEKKIDI